MNGHGCLLSKSLNGRLVLTRKGMRPAIGHVNEPLNTAIEEDRNSHGCGNVMVTDAVETRLQQKLRPGLCAINPDKPFDFSELAYLLPRDAALRQFVDQ